ncbi:acyl-CoA dehydrogenase family protein [Devosia sp.]|uniref:acyl-CoA dehydrogenase family protein n=1 Tax=Devosia sp. TaxID=1871048 RepID=UPI001AC33D31|nr:acyl-CoA dehydrogenase family protein [Devosia sp.]MBN9332619.1 acyl-CoA/acyl-ACP dehydrogenase [Devosia sp.]
MSTNQRLDDIRSRLATVTSTIALGAADRDRASRFEIAPFEALHAAGLLAYGLPAEYGGAGRSIAEVGTIIREVARADASVGLVLSMYFISHVGAARQRHWSADLHQRLVADALKRPALINGAQSEPALGSPMRGGALQTRAERTSSGWRISGHKNFVTGSEGLSWFVVSAQTEQGQTGSWLVPGGSQVSIQKTWNNLGMRATASHDVIFEGVDVPENALIDLREPGQRPNSAQGSVRP